MVMLRLRITFSMLFLLLCDSEVILHDNKLNVFGNSFLSAIRYFNLSQFDDNKFFRNLSTCYEHEKNDPYKIIRCQISRMKLYITPLPSKLSLWKAVADTDVDIAFKKSKIDCKYELDFQDFINSPREYILQYNFKIIQSNCQSKSTFAGGSTFETFAYSRDLLSLPYILLPCR